VPGLLESLADGGNRLAGPGVPPAAVGEDDGDELVLGRDVEVELVDIFPVVDVGEVGFEFGVGGAGGRSEDHGGGECEGNSGHGRPPGRNNFTMQSYSVKPDLIWPASSPVRPTPRGRTGRAPASRRRRVR